MISNNKLFLYTDRIRKETFTPITADIFLTNYCNNNCRYCTYKRWALEGGKYSVKYDDFVKCCERLETLGVQGIILTGGGEPTLCKDFDRITEYLEKRNVPYGINTNFNLLKFFSPNYLKVSLDGWDEESYSATRGVKAYGKTKQNIKNYVDWRNENNYKTKVSIQCIATSVENVQKYYSANNSLPVDYIIFRPIESTAGKYYQNIKNRKEITKIIQEIKKLQKIDKRVKINYKFDDVSAQENRCVANWSQIAVNEKMQVMYCCHKPYEIVGNLMDDNILEKKAKFKTNLEMCDVPCRLTGPNYSMEKIYNIVGDISDKEFI